jgi:hypothetical protein
MRTSIKAVVVLGAALMSLTACAKPVPSVTLVSGSISVHAEAACWAVDCLQVKAPAHPTTLAVTPGRTFGISVDSEIAEAGWQPAIIVNGQVQALDQKVIHKRYWRMTFPESARGAFPAGGLQLQIASRAAADGNSGVWVFTLTDAETTDNA